MSAEETSAIRRSLQDLEDEHAAGDLDETGYASLKAHYTALATASERAGGEPRDQKRASPPGGEPGRDLAAAGRAARARRRRIWRVGGVAGGLALLGAGTVAILLSATGDRLPGQSVTGALSLSTAQRAKRLVAQADVLSRSGRQAEALAAYRRALALEPSDPAALLGSGWLERLAGVQSRDSSLAAEGRKQIADAVALAPRAPEGHLLLGIVLFEDERDAGDAVTQFRLFLADKPPRQEVAASRPVFTAAFEAAGDPLPPGVRP